MTKTKVITTKCPKCDKVIRVKVNVPKDSDNKKKTTQTFKNIYKLIKQGIKNREKERDFYLHLKLHGPKTQKKFFDKVFKANRDQVRSYKKSKQVFEADVKNLIQRGFLNKFPLK